MLRKWIGRLLGVEFATPLTTQVWECTPLVILNEAGDVEFSQICTVEFKPTGKASPIGFAEVVGNIGDSPAPKLTITKLVLRGQRVGRSRYDSESSSGMILRGSYMEANMRWYVDGPAIEILDGRYLDVEKSEGQDFY